MIVNIYICIGLLVILIDLYRDWFWSLYYFSLIFRFCWWGFFYIGDFRLFFVSYGIKVYKLGIRDKVLGGGGLYIKLNGFKI